eukprot:TRINITY_DN2282_c1_g1_i2.p1 TRINITY_DN2282_c1_g1~~TRINITY_DN2282_c1_g1_i2.p1  ORF type:complete len:393 (-),score=117.88 TRINITY_DN2282_c1_g1_i2:60-1082(-)
MELSLLSGGSNTAAGSSSSSNNAEEEEEEGGGEEHTPDRTSLHVARRITLRYGHHVRTGSAPVAAADASCEAAASAIIVGSPRSSPPLSLSPRSSGSSRSGSDKDEEKQEAVAAVETAEQLPVTGLLALGAALSLLCWASCVVAVGMAHNWYPFQHKIDECPYSHKAEVRDYEIAAIVLLYAHFAVGLLSFVLVVQAPSYWPNTLMPPEDDGESAKGWCHLHIRSPTAYVADRLRDLVNLLRPRACLLEHRSCVPTQLLVLRAAFVLLALSSAACVALAARGYTVGPYFGECLEPHGKLHMWLSGSVPVLAFSFLPVIGHALLKAGLVRIYRLRLFMTED